MKRRPGGTPGARDNDELIDALSVAVRAAAMQAAADTMRHAGFNGLPADMADELFEALLVLAGTSNPRATIATGILVCDRCAWLEPSEQVLAAADRRLGMHSAALFLAAKATA